VDGKSHVVLPRIGWVRAHEPTTALLERIEAGRARILRATVSREGGRWFVRFTCEVEREPKTPRFPDAAVGVDIGLRELAVLSTGERVPNPRPLEKALRTLARLHARLARIRRDAMHKRTTWLARTCGISVVGTLNVRGMLRKRRLAWAVADAAMAELRRQLAYNTVWYGHAWRRRTRSTPAARHAPVAGR
jgi:putative transposase